MISCAEFEAPPLELKFWDILKAVTLLYVYLFVGLKDKLHYNLSKKVSFIVAF
jgi:hypothetical protein